MLLQQGYSQPHSVLVLLLLVVVVLMLLLLLLFNYYFYLGNLQSAISDHHFMDD